MSDDHKVKEFLLTWLIKHGRDVVWNIPVKHFSGEQWDLLGRCIRFGYIDSLQDPFNKHLSNKLTDAGLEFLNKGENNEQQDHNTIKY
jgi:hypothetical protein